MSLYEGYQRLSLSVKVHFKRNETPKLSGTFTQHNNLLMDSFAVSVLMTSGTCWNTENFSQYLLMSVIIVSVSG